jgi:hypothetical protein
MRGIFDCHSLYLPHEDRGFLFQVDWHEVTGEHRARLCVCVYVHYVWDGLCFLCATHSMWLCVVGVLQTVSSPAGQYSAGPP